MATLFVFTQGSSYGLTRVIITIVLLTISYSMVDEA